MVAEIGEGEYLCTFCGTEEETGAHLVFGSKVSSGLQPWEWTPWEELDERRKW